MNRTPLFLLLAMITMGMSGCAANKRAMAGAAVDMPANKPITPGLTEATPSPAPSAHNRENVSPVSATAGRKDTAILIGDVLEVSVAEDRTYNGCYEVRLGGYFILPFVGRIDAVNLTLKEIEANVSKALEATQLPRATVKVEKLGGSSSARWR